MKKRDLEPQWRKLVYTDALSSVWSMIWMPLIWMKAKLWIH